MRAQDAGQADPVALPHGQRRQRARTVVARAEPGESDVDPAVGVPRVQCGGQLERGRVVVLGAGFLGPHGFGGGVHRAQGGQAVGDLLGDEVADRARRRGVQVLVDGPYPPDPRDAAGVRVVAPGQDAQERRLAPTVLPHHGEPRCRGDGEVDAGQDGAVAERHPHVGQADVGAVARGESVMVVLVLVVLVLVVLHCALFGSTWSREARDGRPACVRGRRAKRVSKVVSAAVSGGTRASW